MDWDAMIADLESSFDAERRADLVAQSAELAEAEHASIELVDRLRGSVGRLIHLRTRGGVPVDGVVCRVEPSYVLVDEGDVVAAGTPLIHWDLTPVHDANLSLCVPIVVVTPPSAAVTHEATGPDVSVLAPLFSTTTN